MSSIHSVMPDPSTPFGGRVARRLHDERTIWLTTIDAAGTPQPNPVWYVWDGATFLIYNLRDARRLEHIQRHPQVALHFNTDAQGDNVVVITGEARLSPQEPLADQMPAYVAKYGKAMAGVSGSAAAMAAQYPVAVRIRPTKVRGF